MWQPEWQPDPFILTPQVLAECVSHCQTRQWPQPGILVQPSARTGVGPWHSVRPGSGPINWSVPTREGANVPFNCQLATHGIDPRSALNVQPVQRAPGSVRTRTGVRGEMQ